VSDNVIYMFNIYTLVSSNSFRSSILMYMPKHTQSQNGITVNLFGSNQEYEEEQLVEVLCYKLEDREFESPWDHRIFQLT
jgi:hypothetical protein